MSLIAVGNLYKETIETKMGRITNTCGGELAYFSAAAAILSEINLISQVGEDFDINKISKLSKNIKTEMITKDKNDTSIYSEIIYDYDVYNAKEEKKSHKKLDHKKLVESLSSKETKSNIIYVGEFEPDVQVSILKKQTLRDKLVLAMPKSRDINNIKDLNKIFKYSKIVIMEGKDVIKYNSNSNVFRAVREIFPKNTTEYIIVLTDTSVIFATKFNTMILPVFPIDNIIDVTGHKYSFAGALLSYINAHNNTDENTISNEENSTTYDTTYNTMLEALTYANIVSSFCIEGLGLNGFLNVDIHRIFHRYKEYRSLVPIPKLRLIN